jgi:hypothetical protein
MTQLTDNGIFSIQIPLDATDIVLHNDPPKLVFSSAIQDPAQCGGDIIALSPGSYEFLFCTKGCSEEDARKAVRELPVGARFNNYSGDYPVWYHTGKDSLASLLRSKKLDQNKNYAVIQKVS